MTTDMERLAGMAADVWGAEAVLVDETGFELKAAGETLLFYSPGEAAYAGYCRAKVGALGNDAERALKGGFFWRGSNGAVPSLNPSESALYLTDRFDAGAFADAVALETYVVNFLRTLVDWRAREEVQG